LVSQTKIGNKKRFNFQKVVKQTIVDKKMTPQKKKQLVTNKLKLPQKKPILPNVVVTWNILACLDHKGFFWDLENSRCFFAM